MRRDCQIPDAIERTELPVESGELAEAERLLPLVYNELRRLAASFLERERPGHTLDATSLVHEAYFRLRGDRRFENRAHFFAAASEAMRRILVNQARDRKRLKRGEAGPAWNCSIGPPRSPRIPTSCWPWTR
jgi:RNA polymerase sigma factor (TIGR02999 family)